MPDQTVKFDDERDDEPREAVPTDDERALARKMPDRAAKAALALVLQGASNAEAAEICGYDSPGQCRAAWEDLLGRSFEHEADPTAFRRMQSARLNRQLKTVSSIAFASTVTVPDPDGSRTPDGKIRTVEVANPRQMEALKEFRATVDSLSKLHGLEAPKVLAMVTPDAKQFDMVVSTVAGAIRSGGAVEGNIFGDEDVVDAEVVDE